MFLDEQDVRALLRMEELIPAMADALRDLSAGRVEQPLRQVLPVTEHQGFFGVMPAYGGALGAKLVTFYPNNKSVPTHHAMILLFRPETGEPLVTMDGRLITEMRTAAVSALATDALARADASVLAILGSGVQARSHLAALRIVRRFREVRVWSPRNASEFGVDCIAGTRTSNPISHPYVGYTFPNAYYPACAAVTQCQRLVQTAANRLHGREQAVAADLADDFPNQVGSRLGFLKQIHPRLLDLHPLGANADDGMRRADEHSTGRRAGHGPVLKFEAPVLILRDLLHDAWADPNSPCPVHCFQA